MLSYNTKNQFVENRNSENIFVVAFTTVIAGYTRTSVADHHGVCGGHTAEAGCVLYEQNNELGRNYMNGCIV